jgi:hypothetical protein
MLTLKQIQDYLADRNLSSVSRATRIPYHVVWRIARNKNKYVNAWALNRLSNYLLQTQPPRE